MKLGNPRGLISRREKRRDREAEEIRHGLTQQPLKEAPRVKPATLRPEQRHMSPVLLNDDEVLRRRKGRGPIMPDQKTLFKKCIRPRQQVQVIVWGEKWLDELDVRHSVIEDIDKKGRLYLAQTGPPILLSHKGQKVRLTFLNRYSQEIGSRWIRVGYDARIIDVLRDYELGPNLKENVFVVEGPKKLEEETVRTAYRIVPPDDLDLRLYIWPDMTELGLMDISLGGARFYHFVGWHFSKSSKMDLALVSGDVKLILVGKVMRHDTVEDRFGTTHGVTSVQWVNMDAETRNKYMQLVTESYRHLLAQRSGVAKGETVL